MIQPQGVLVAVCGVWVEGSVGCTELKQNIDKSLAWPTPVCVTLSIYNKLTSTLFQLGVDGAWEGKAATRSLKQVKHAACDTVLVQLKDKVSSYSIEANFKPDQSV